MNPKVLTEAAKRLKEHPEVSSRLLNAQFKRSSWLKPESIGKKPIKLRLTKVQKDILKSFERFMEVNACLECGTPFGGWCKNCEKYSSGKNGRKN